MGRKEERLANKAFTCCSVEGCTRQGSIQRGVETFRKGFCEAHYQRFRKYGDAQYPPQRCEHGFSLKKHPLYRLWTGIKTRIFNKNSHLYKDYGGRGITICDRWIEIPHGFLNFVEDVGERPSPEYSIDRIDNNGNYEPGNVKWSTPHEQSANQRSSGKYLGVRWRAAEIQHGVTYTHRKN
jgi:hypothetical protein